MTDMTTNTRITGQSRTRHRPPTREYCVYFAVIFAATLPLTCLTWALTTLRRMEMPERGPIHAAWSQARIITPRIFSA